MNLRPKWNPPRATAETNWTPVRRDPNQRALREAANESCVGGQGNPRGSLDLVPGMGAVSWLIRAVFTVFHSQHKVEVEKVANGFAPGSPCGPDPTLLLKYRGKFREGLGAGPDPSFADEWGTGSGLQANIFHSWLSRARGSEKSLRGWIPDGSPSGIERGVEAHGIFPLNDRPARGCTARAAEHAQDSGIHNYPAMKE